MKLFNSTKKWSDWWIKRKINWKDHYMNPEHPHRQLIADVLRCIPWISLIEVGCAAGANLITIVKSIPNKQVGGIDLNKDAIEYAKTQFNGGMFKVGSVTDIPMSDKACDVILTDMTMIYITPSQMKLSLSEIKRVARGYVVFCEFHSTSWWKRFAVKWSSGYNMYDYKRLLDKQGFYDIALYKIPKEMWPGGLQEKYGYIIVARIPNY
jgi:ubiquinone/menaquinone biosynthesis C-methylase UbiE